MAATATGILHGRQVRGASGGGQFHLPSGTMFDAGGYRQRDGHRTAPEESHIGDFTHVDGSRTMCRHALMHFEIIGELVDVSTFAVGSSIRENARLRKKYGQGRWRKREGFARVRLSDGTVHRAENHWCQATGIGRREFKIKRLTEGS